MAIQKYTNFWANGRAPNSLVCTYPSSGYSPETNMPAYMRIPSSTHLSDGRMVFGSDLRLCFLAREPSTKSKNSFASKHGPTRTPPKKKTYEKYSSKDGTAVKARSARKVCVDSRSDNFFPSFKACPSAMLYANIEAFTVQIISN